MAEIWLIFDWHVFVKEKEKIFFVMSIPKDESIRFA